MALLCSSREARAGAGALGGWSRRTQVPDTGFLFFKMVLTRSSCASRLCFRRCVMGAAAVGPRVSAVGLNGDHVGGRGFFSPGLHETQKTTSALALTHKAVQKTDLAIVIAFQDNLLIQKSQRV